MRKSITWQLGVIIVCVLFISMLITSFSNYYVSYKKTYEAAGIEAVGCANITTGLIDPGAIETIIQGNNVKLGDLENTLNWTTQHKQIFENQYIISLEGYIIAADDNLKNQGYQAGDSFYLDEEAVKMIMETRHPHYSDIYEFGGMKRLTGYAPIFKDQDPNKEIIALNAIDFSGEIVTERTWDSVKGSFVIGLLPIILASFITIWLIRRKTRPISILTEYAQKIAEGDLSQKRIAIANKDEIGELAETLNIMAGNLRSLIEQVHSSSEKVAASSEELTASAAQTNYATEQISDTMSQVAASAGEQVQSVESSTQAVNELSIGVHQISGNAQSVAETAMDASDKALEGGQAIKLAVEQMNSINLTVNGLGEVVRGLGNRSDEIGQIIEVISGIAKQTNLLALNAAIEAARAGEQGRGFAVVADEVRKLAEQSASSAHEISLLIHAIQAETDKAVQSMEFATLEATAGIQAVNSAGDSFSQIQEAVRDVSFQIQEVSSAVQQMAAGTQQMVHSMQVISAISEATSTSTREISTSTEDQLAAMQEITASASELSRMADELQKQVSKFKIN
ncbi:methyl-accepting chemotaxis protein [Mesobacillus foraminis]|uniref:methyl-accepting chemotaxis protein n=1 Tax=Mesobacillus foraminis TaxID=279826 RepID=UPI001BEBA115|nr:methyl-accepting chemotaxis protein [Mesobacillus foraminis]MBT2756521.1 methyl-accepting chemotaxis protein [Mesobacillus foraminis]